MPPDTQLQVSAIVSFNLQEYLEALEARLTARMEAGFDAITDRLDVLNGRVRKTETAIAWIWGAGAGVTGIAALLAYFR